jgi:hypothetical protein
MQSSVQIFSIRRTHQEEHSRAKVGWKPMLVLITSKGWLKADAGAPVINPIVAWKKSSISPWNLSFW